MESQESDSEESSDFDDVYGFFSAWELLGEEFEKEAHLLGERLTQNAYSDIFSYCFACTRGCLGGDHTPCSLFFSHMILLDILDK